MPGRSHIEPELYYDIVLCICISNAQYLTSIAYRYLSRHAYDMI